MEHLFIGGTVPGVADLTRARGMPLPETWVEWHAAQDEDRPGPAPRIRARLEGWLFSGQDPGCPMPDPGLSLHAAQALGAEPARCVIIEDSGTGALTSAGAEPFAGMAAPPGL